MKHVCNDKAQILWAMLDGKRAPRCCVAAFEKSIRENSRMVRRYWESVMIQRLRRDGFNG